MTFGKKDLETLLKIYGGHRKFLAEDLPQIELAADMTAYSFGTNDSNERTITRIGTIRKIGRQAWISGLVRSAFHRTAIRYVDDSDESKGYVYFDSRNMFR